MVSETSGRYRTGLTGFQDFRARINGIAELLGHNEHVRTAVAHEFHTELTRAIERRLGVRAHSLPHDVDWTLAEDADFEVAASHVEDVVCRIRKDDPVVASAPWRGASLVQRGLCVWLEGGPAALLVAMCGDPRDATDRFGEESGEKWSVFMNESGLVALSGYRFSLGPMSTITHAKSREGAEKALRSMVARFFGVKLAKAPKS